MPLPAELANIQLAITTVRLFLSMQVRGIQLRNYTAITLRRAHAFSFSFSTFAFVICCFFTNKEISSSSRHSVVTGEQQVCACACEAITPTVTDLFENSINFSAIHDFQISRKKTYIVLSYSAKIDGVKDTPTVPVTAASSVICPRLRLQSKLYV